MVRAKPNLKNEARLLRQAGLSINEIYKRIGAAKSSVSIWVRDVPLSISARRRIESRWTKGQNAAHAKRREITKQKLLRALENGRTTVNRVVYTKEVSQLSCALLYWCEGAKSQRDSDFSFMNSDPRLIASFLSLLREGFDIKEEKFRVYIHLHDYHDEGKQLQFWSQVTKIPLSQFSNPYRKPHTGKQIRDGYAGCASVRYYDVEIARELQGIARAFLEKKGGL